MTGDQVVLLALGGLAALCLVLLVALLRLRAGSRRSTEELHTLQRRLDDLERARAKPPAPTPQTTPAEFVITGLGDSRAEPQVPVRIDGPAFADLVVRETVVKAASLAQGVRRGLAPATRNRIRFEMKQEVRRSRKQRRADLKAAQRQLRAQQRAGLPPEERAGNPSPESTESREAS